MFAAMTRQLPVDKDLEKARRRSTWLDAKTAEVIKIMTAEQAILAQKVVLEAGRRRKR